MTRLHFQRNAHRRVKDLFESAVAPLASGDSWARRVQVTRRTVAQNAPEQVMIGALRVVESNVDPNDDSGWSSLCVDDVVETIELDVTVIVNWAHAKPDDDGHEQVAERAYDIADALATAIETTPIDGAIHQLFQVQGDAPEPPEGIDLDYHGARVILDAVVQLTGES